MTREEFNKRWIYTPQWVTLESIVECAQEWGLVDSDRINTLAEIKYRVLVEAGVHNARDYKPIVENQADSAALISAAPELFAALKEMVCLYQENRSCKTEPDDIINMAMSAIAKATGGSND